MRAVILAGGRGRRLDPYTTILPKPLMPIGDVPILEVVIRQLRRAGFDEVTMAVGYLAELIVAYFGDGSKFGTRISYSREDKPLGTAGPLGLIEGLGETFLVMNGDLLTTCDYGAMYDQHSESGALATMATYQKQTKIDLGVIETDGRWVRKYIEKPTYDFTVSTGIYVLEPEILRFIPKRERLDLPDLVTKVIESGKLVGTYPIEGYWLDIGRHDDYEEALREFDRNRDKFLPR